MHLATNGCNERGIGVQVPKEIYRAIQEHSSNSPLQFFVPALNSTDVFQISCHKKDFSILNQAINDYLKRQQSKEQVSGNDYLQCQSSKEQISDSFIRHLLTTKPIRKIMSDDIKKIPNEKERNAFKQRLFDYEIKHSTEILRAQTELNIEAAAEAKAAILKKWPSYREYLNAKDKSITEGKKSGNMLYEAFGKKPVVWQNYENTYKKTIIPKLVETIHPAFELLQKIQEAIFTTKWPIGIGIKVHDKNGHTNTVPSHMVTMLDIIQRAYEKDNTGKDSQCWNDAYQKVARIGKLAAANKPFSLFGIGKRSNAAQEFYKRFEEPTSQGPSRKNKK